MAINFKLRAVRRFSADGDDMDRTWVGYESTLPSTLIYEQNRGVWWVGRRARDERWATFSAEGVVKVVVELHDVETIPSKRETRAKSAIIGRVLEPGDQAHDWFIGRGVDGHRNPVTYIPDPDF
jgi:hypothetical protein